MWLRFLRIKSIKIKHIFKKNFYYFKKNYKKSNKKYLIKVQDTSRMLALRNLALNIEMTWINGKYPEKKIYHKIQKNDKNQNSVNLPINTKLVKIEKNTNLRLA